MQALIGVKKVQSQRFMENGMRIPVTLIDVKDNCVVAVRTHEKNKYQAVQLGFGIRKNANRAQMGHAKGAKLEKAPKFLREVRIRDESEILPEVGSTLNPSEVFQPGDIVDVTGISKGKGFAGVVKRHGFHGGPKTHGQSDRHRAPGAIGQGTTPGRVYRGKRMAGRMGNENITVQNLKIVDVTADGALVIKGLVPGIINNLIYIEKVGEDKKFVPLWKEAETVSSEAAGSSSVSDDAQTVKDDSKSSEPSSLSESQSTESVENSSKDVGSTLDSSENGQPPAVQEETKDVKPVVSSEQPEAETKEVKDAR